MKDMEGAELPVISSLRLIMALCLISIGAGFGLLFTGPSDQLAVQYMDVARAYIARAEYFKETGLSDVEVREKARKFVLKALRYAPYNETYWQALAMLSDGLEKKRIRSIVHSLKVNKNE